MTSGLNTYDIDPPVLNPDGIAESQTVSADDLALDGDLCDSGTSAQFDIGDSYGSAIRGVKLVFDAAGDISSAIFTITGQDEYGVDITEVVTGVDTSGVETTNYYSQVTVIAVTVAEAAAVFVGTINGAMVGPSIVLNRYSQSGAAVSIAGMSGTMSWSIEQTFDPVAQTGISTSVVWAPPGDTALTTTTANASGALERSATGVRLVINSYTDTAELQFSVASNPYR